MAIDPQLKLLLDQIVSAGQPPVWEQTPQAAREGMRAFARMTDAREVPVGKVETRTIAGGEGEIGARCYTPVAAGSAPLAALVYFHGGGFVVGDLDTHDTLCRALAAEAGCKVVAVDYRLAPENKFPAAVEDAYAATKWVEDNASMIGVDPNRVAVGGDSSGANLAAVVTQLAKAKGAPKIVYQLLFYPVTQLGEDTPSRQQFADDVILNRKARSWFREQYLDPGVSPDDPRAAPLAASDLSGLPPAYVLTAGCDPLLDEGRQYADRLREAGVPVEYVCYDQMTHGFLNMSALVETAHVAIERAGQALKAAFA
jgi:acetyl esterase/lipase